PNMSSVMAARGYTPVYKGKWHLDKPAGSSWMPHDVGKYGFERWNPPDGGANQDISEAGGGTTNHDGRYMDSVGTAEAGAEGVLADTLVIRTADHGEMGLAHGGLRQKNFNVYEETTRVPLVYSNPRLFPRPRRSSALVSHVDFLPTLATLFGAPRSARANWQG